MRVMLTALVLFTSEMANAGLYDDLRELRGTISETSRTAKEATELGKVITPEKKPEVQAPAQTSDINSGDVLKSKLGKLKLFSAPSKKSASLGQVSKADEMIFMGEEKEGFYRVTVSDGEGWVDKLLVQKR
jgi:hypothetical protein